MRRYAWYGLVLGMVLGAWGTVWGVTRTGMVQEFEGIYYPIRANTTTCTDVALNAAVTAMQALSPPRNMLELSPVDGAGAACTWVLAADVTIPRGITLVVPDGAGVSVNTGKVLTLNGPLVASDSNWASGAGSVVLNYREWSTDAMTSFISTGCLPGTSGSTTLSAFGCSAQITSGGQWYPVEQPAASVGPLTGGTGTYWLAIHRDTTTAVSGWTRQTGTHYLWRMSAAKPSNPASGLIIAQATVTGAGAINPILDYRKPLSLLRSLVYDITDPLYGGVGDAVIGGSGTDNVGAYNLAAAAAGTEGGVLWIPAGRYNFASKPNALQNGTMLQCPGQKFTVLVRKYTEGGAATGFIDMDVANTLPTAGVTNAGGGIQNCALYAETGTTGGSAVNISSTSLVSQGFIHIDFTYVTGAGTWNYDIYMNGSLATGSPQGVRSIFISNSHFFQSTVAGIIALGVNNVGIANVGVFTNTDQCLIIDGGTGGTVSTNYVRADMIFCDKAKIGATQTTNQVWYSSPNTTTLVTSSSMNNLTVAGNVGTITGTASIGSAGTGLMSAGKVLSGVSVATTGGGKLETSDGLTFPATQFAVANPNTLDDYKEATWTPTLGGTTTDGTPTYTIQDGIYTKIGRLVTLNARLGWSNWVGSPAGALVVRFAATGFTPTSGSGSAAYPCAVASDNLVVGAAGNQLQALIAGGVQHILIQKSDVTGGVSQNLTAGADTDGNLYVSCTFFTTP